MRLNKTTTAIAIVLLIITLSGIGLIALEHFTLQNNMNKTHIGTMKIVE